MIDNLQEIIKEEQRIAEGRGPVNTREQRESDELNSGGWELHCRGSFEEAIKCFDKAISLNPRHALAMNNKGLSLRRLGRLEEAIEWFDRAIKVAPRFVKPYSNKGETLGMMGRREEAAKWFQKALEVEPCYPRAIQGLQQYCGRLPSSDEERRAKQLIERYPEAMKIAIEGSAYMGIAQFDEALKRFNEVLRLAPNVPEFLDMKAECLCNKGEFQEALNYVTRATELNQNLAPAWVNRAWANLSLFKFEEALQCAERALKLNPNLDMAWNNAGAALMMLGRYSDAVERFKQALSFNPNNPIAKMNLGVCLRKIEPPDFVFLGLESLDLARPTLEKGRRVAISFDFGNPNINWKEIITLTQQYERLVVVDTFERNVEQIRAMVGRLVQSGGSRLALDLTIIAQESERRK